MKRHSIEKSGVVGHLDLLGGRRPEEGEFANWQIAVCLQK